MSNTTTHDPHSCAPRGGVDKMCNVVVNLLPRGEVRVSKSDLDLYAADSFADDAVKNAVGREIDKRKQ